MPHPGPRALRPSRPARLPRPLLRRPGPAPAGVLPTSLGPPWGRSTRAWTVGPAGALSSAVWTGSTRSWSIRPGRSGDLTVRSDDHGATWTRLPLGPGIRSLALDPGAPSTLYAVDAATVWKSADGGASWSSWNAGLPADSGFELRQIAVDPSGSGTVVLATSRGVFLLAARRSAWTPLAGLENLSALSVAIDPFDPARIYAGTAAGGGLFVYHRQL